jgi:hypothetical protein
MGVIDELDYSDRRYIAVEHDGCFYVAQVRKSETQRGILSGGIETAEVMTAHQAADRLNSQAAKLHAANQEPKQPVRRRRS